MGGVEAQRGEHRRDVRVEVGARVLALLVREVRPAGQADAVTSQPRSERRRVAPCLLVEQLEGPAAYAEKELAPLLGGRGRVVGGGPERRDPLHEKLVQVRGEDGEE